MVLCLLLYWLSLCLCLLDFCNINMKIVHKKYFIYNFTQILSVLSFVRIS